MSKLLTIGQPERLKVVFSSTEFSTDCIGDHHSTVTCEIEVTLLFSIPSITQLNRGTIMEALSGECLCGAITYECTESALMAGHCQCTDCQKISGAGHASNIAVPKGSLNISGQLSFHEKVADSGNTVKRGFCPDCGCHIYAENSGMQQFEFIRAGSLHNLELFSPGMVVYARSGASWDHTDPSLPHFETTPEM